MSDQQGGVEEIGARLEVPVAGVFDENGFAVGGFEGCGAVAGIGPEALDVALAPGKLAERQGCFVDGGCGIAGAIGA